MHKLALALTLSLALCSAAEARRGHRIKHGPYGGCRVVVSYWDPDVGYRNECGRRVR